MEIDFKKASFRDFENIAGMNPWERAVAFNAYLDFLQASGHLNYRMKVVWRIWSPKSCWNEKVSPTGGTSVGLRRQQADDL